VWAARQKHHATVPVVAANAGARGCSKGITSASFALAPPPRC
jgi:hypothetical protein